MFEEKIRKHGNIFLKMVKYLLVRKKGDKNPRFVAITHDFCPLKWG